MRKILCLLFLLLLLPYISQAQIWKKSEKVEKARKLYTNLRLSVLNLFLGRLSGQYEMQVGKSAINFTGNVSFSSNKPGYLLGMGYRYYFSSKRTSSFIGLIANFSDYKKSYTETIEGQTTQGDFRLWGQTVTAGVNIGKRWSILRLFNITARAGYGYPIQINDLTWQPTGDNQIANSLPINSNTLSRKYLFTSGIDAEISFGFHFGK